MFNPLMYQRAQILYEKLKDRYPKKKELNHLICCMQIVGEIKEVLDCVPWKFERSDKSTDKSRDELLEELIDIFKYYCRLLCIHDITPKEFQEAFNKKSDIVERRLLCQETQT